MCALVGGRSSATTMGFSPLSGSDGDASWRSRPRPAALATQAKGMTVKAIEAMLYHECGLKGVSGISGDMRDLLASGDHHARQAVDLFIYRMCWELGSLAAAAGASMPWSSPPVSAKTRPLCAKPSAASQPGSVSSSTPKLMRVASNGSAQPPVPSPSG